MGSNWSLCFSVELEQRTRSSPQTQGGVWKLITGRKATISSQRMNSSSSVTRSPEREPPVGGEGQTNGQEEEEILEICLNILQKQFNFIFALLIKV